MDDDWGTPIYWNPHVDNDTVADVAADIQFVVDTDLGFLCRMFDMRIVSGQKIW